MKIETVKLSELKPWPGNPRAHGPDVDALVRSVETFGWTNPILVQRGTNRVIAGHGRLLAAKKAGLKEVPVIFLDLNDQQADAYTIADNRLAENSEWDEGKLKEILIALDDGAFDIGLTGFDRKALDKMIDAEGETQADVYPEMELHAFEHHDYCVAVFRNSMDFLKAVEVLGLRKVAVKIKNGKDKIGLCRIIDGAKLLDLLDGRTTQKGSGLKSGKRASAGGGKARHPSAEDTEKSE